MSTWNELENFCRKVGYRSSILCMNLLHSKIIPTLREKTITWSNTPDITGANIDPTRANIDAMETALFLITVGNSSAV